MKVKFLVALLALFTFTVFAETDLNWSMRPDRNLATTAKNLPVEVGTNNVLWSVKIGSHQYSIPVIEGDHMYLGVNDSLHDNANGGGMVLCIDKNTAKEIWKHHVPRNRSRSTTEYHFNHFSCGICSSPVIQGNRLYVVASDGGVICLEKSSGKLLWRYDFIKELDVVPHDVCGSTILLKDGRLYVCTSNGINYNHTSIPNPKAPSLVVLDALSGKLLIKAEERISAETWHGQWSSPAAGGGLIFFGGADGRCYSFEADTLKQVWVADCNPREYRYDKYGAILANSTWNKRIATGPNPVIGTVVYYDNKLYVATGQSPYHGKGQGVLNCFDAASGKLVWRNDKVERTTATVAISEGLLYIADFSERMHCIDALTGESLWTHELEGDVWCASPVVADGKVYIGTSRQHMWVFKAGREKQVLSKTRLKSVPITVVAEDNRLYIPTQRALTAYGKRQLQVGGL